MKEPMTIGGKSNSPGSKILKKIKKTMLLQNQIITKDTGTIEASLTEKEKVKNLNFKFNKVLSEIFQILKYRKQIKI